MQRSEGGHFDGIFDLGKATLLTCGSIVPLALEGGAVYPFIYYGPY